MPVFHERIIYRSTVRWRNPGGVVNRCIELLAFTRSTDFPNSDHWARLGYPNRNDNGMDHPDVPISKDPSARKYGRARQCRNAGECKQDRYNRPSFHNISIVDTTDVAESRPGTMQDSRLNPKAHLRVKRKAKWRRLKDIYARLSIKM
jgi:hypothetical protein